MFIEILMIALEKLKHIQLHPSPKILFFNIEVGSYKSKEESSEPFFPNKPFLYPLQTSENRKVFQCFQGLEKGCIENKWLVHLVQYVNGFCNLLQILVFFSIKS